MGARKGQRAPKQIGARAGVSSARGHPEQGRPRGSSLAQPKVKITRQAHDDEAGLRSSQEVNLQVRVRSSNCWADLRFELARQFLGSAGCIDRQGQSSR